MLLYYISLSIYTIYDNIRSPAEIGDIAQCRESSGYSAIAVDKTEYANIFLDLRCYDGAGGYEAIFR